MSIYTRVSEQARQANASPSISLEKGAYRMRAPTKRVPGPSALRHDPVTSNHRPSASNVSINNLVQSERYIMLLVMLLVVGTISCFSAAYYLFKTSPRALS
ncbi:hypothetical protein K474DRAFT_1667123 [Panus rudis PR-1116 ss-1]|nr:hypothetical protein K474DRAFT_1667123 [Panus rudis PR-1116 ss-1]